MKTYKNNRKGCIHLYNPKKEGLGSYDMHYINGYKKKKGMTNYTEIIDTERYVA